MDIAGVLARQLQRIDERSSTDDGCAVLVIVHHRNVQLLLQSAFNLESLGRLDVLEVDAPEGGRDGLDGLNEGLHIGSVHLDVEAIEVGEYLEKHALALHDRFGGLGTDVPQSQDGRAIGDDRNEVALGGVAVNVFRVAGNLEAGLRDAGRIRQAQVTLGAVWLGGNDLHLAPSAPAVIVEGLFPADAAHRL